MSEDVRPVGGALSRESWRKSSFSDSGDCVEVYLADSFVLVRNTRDRSLSSLTFGRPQWAAFLAGIRHGNFDDRVSGPA